MFSSKQNAAPLCHECDRNCRPRVSPGTHRRQKGAKTSPKGVARHSQATERGINVVQGCRLALTSNEKGHKRRPRVPPGTHRQQKEPETLPKGAARHSQATKRGENVAQGCRPALTGDRKGHKRRPRVPPGTHRRQKEPETLPKGAARHSQATKRGENVAQGCRPALTGDRKGHKRRPRAQPSPQVTTVAGSTADEAPDAPPTLVKICLLEKPTVRAFGGRSPCLWWRLGGSG